MMYEEFLAGKAARVAPCGIEPPTLINQMLFPWQRQIVAWALRRGRACIWADCGLGKTPMQLEWAHHVPGRVLVIAPLAVAHQTIREGAKFGIDAEYARDGADTDADITVTNYEMLDRFDPARFAGVVLDESSILKAYDGKTKQRILDTFRDVPFRLACTATPAPNDHMELGNHAEFVGAMTREEMLAMFFVHDSGETQKRRIKGHGRAEFWAWVASWAIMMRRPSDLGFDDDGFLLPALSMHQYTSAAGPVAGQLFPSEAATLPERIAARRETVGQRVKVAADLINASDEEWVVWCGLNAESDALVRAIPDAIDVRGSHGLDEKESRLLAFSRREARVMVTKPRIAGFGLNWQHCRNVAFVGLSDSWEQYYQAVRRCWRFGQSREVRVHVITHETEGAVVRNIKRKEDEAAEMAKMMVDNMSEFNKADLSSPAQPARNSHDTDAAVGAKWDMRLGDCVDVLGEIDDDSLHYSIFSPPFASLYTYTDNPRDMGNTRTHTEFFAHFQFAVDELYRAMMPGRLCSFHCMQIPTSKARDGIIGITDFRGDLIRLFSAAGFVLHSEVCIWKDPVMAMQRTKALGLLHKQLKKDSCMSRQGIADYLVTMRKPGDNPERVTHTNESFPVQLWQKYASPVWMDISPSDVLPYRGAREHEDERHICPLQLEVIRRAISLWSNPGDLVFSPFGGIGSEGYVALEMDRRYLGVEIKRSYWEQAIRNLRSAGRQVDLFDLPAAESS